MTPWLTLSIGLLLGQTPPGATSLPPDADIQDPAALAFRDAWEQAFNEERASPTASVRQELAQLRTQVESLQSQLQAQQEESTARTGLVEQEILGMRERAEQQERLRIRRLELLGDASLWVLAADEALAVGELDISDALNEADEALAEVLESATETGQGQTVLLVENVRTRIAFALEAAGRRSVYEARWALYDAGWELRQARRHTLDRPDTTVLTP
jgi:hypothetical protein